VYQIILTYLKSEGGGVKCIQYVPS
jgi:hypothetical protein